MKRNRGLAVLVVAPVESVATTTLYLVRHAHADWEPDEARPLSEAGRRAARTVTELLSAFPIIAIYSSPAPRSIETVSNLAERLGLCPTVIRDLRERELPAIPAIDFERVVLESWNAPTIAAAGGESNAAAQTRALDVVRRLVIRHAGQHLVIATHGNLLALILNGLNPAFGYEFWRQLSLPDVYELQLDGVTMVSVRRIWKEVAGDC
jgi:2,3-bisphosphoglycerate-dependent phosphoglycerate mutase